MLNFINKILNYFGYTLTTITVIKDYKFNIQELTDSLSDSNVTNYNLNKDKDRLINLVAEKDKDILALEHKVENFHALIEQDKLTIEDLNNQTIELADKISRLDTDIIDLSNQYNLSYNGAKELASQRYKEINTLRSNNKSLRESRDNYKRKYREVCGKIALKKCH